MPRSETIVQLKPDDWLSVKEVAALLGLESTHLVYDACRARMLKHVRHGIAGPCRKPRIRILRQDAEAYLKSITVQAVPVSKPA